MSPVRAWSLALALVAAVPASAAAQEAVSSPREIPGPAPLVVSVPNAKTASPWACGASLPNPAWIVLRAGNGKDSRRSVARRGPLYVVDGRILGSGESIRQIDPERIERADVISPSDAVQRFGQHGANGAVVITLKQPG